VKREAEVTAIDISDEEDIEKLHVLRVSIFMNYFSH
jgi:hypothetical protein